MPAHQLVKLFKSRKASPVEAAKAALASHGIVSQVELGGVNSVLTAAQLDVPLTYEGMQAAGSGLGSASFMVA